MAASGAHPPEVPSVAGNTQADDTLPSIVGRGGANCRITPGHLPPPPPGAFGQQLVGGVVGVQDRGVAPPVAWPLRKGFTVDTETLVGWGVKIGFPKTVFVENWSFR